MIATLLAFAYFYRSVFNSVESALALSYGTPLPFAPLNFSLINLKHWVMPQLLMVIEVFVTLNQPINPLCHQTFQGVLNPAWLAIVINSSGKAIRDLAFLI